MSSTYIILFVCFKTGDPDMKPPALCEAGDEICTFRILNVSSLQLIPVNMLAYRSQYGSVNPTVIIGPAIVSTLISTFVAVIYCKWKTRDIGMATSLMMSCTETIFYTMSVYFLAAKVTKTRYTLKGALLATLVSTVCSILFARAMV